ncbi:hypothetical protein PINS_up011636 [Pythium insidiosum]|nr:hypothetical protein PINS_up011636 [Pythium insidiosum]
MSSPASAAEPKPSSAEDAAVRKSSKKAATKKVSDASAPSSASPGPNTPAAAASAASTRPAGPTSVSSAESGGGPPPIVPRIPLAEPKLEGGDGSGATAAKTRSSKKRTSTEDSGPTVAAAAALAGPSLTPANTEGSAPKSDVDAEKERARREAKRQKAKELEEQRRREELERQALEEARRVEEQRLREERRKRELAALNANAEDVQEEEPSGYDDEGFENYDDDFENDEPPAQSKPSAKPTPRSKASPAVADPPVELKKIQQALKAESKELSTSRPSSSSSTATAAKSTPPPASSEAKRSKTSSSSAIASSIVGLKQSLDPRARRVKDILDARKLETEKFNLFQQPPLSETEKYMSQLRRGHVRQTFVQTNEGAKVMATQTKPPQMVDKAMHFPDDIGVDDGGVGVRRGRRYGTTGKADKSNQDGDGGDEDDAAGGDDNDGALDDDDESRGSSSSSRFFRFLEQAALLCEVLVEGNLQQHTSSGPGGGTKARHLTSSSQISREQLFPSKGCDVSSGLKRLLATRRLVSIRFSPAVSNILLTAHAPTEDQQEASSNQLDNKSISCIWDINCLDDALFALKNEGIVTSCCLGPGRELFAVTGTEDGSINVWDLRSRLAIPGVTQLQHTQLSVYSPTYSTSGMDSRATANHNSSIVSLQPLRSRDLSSASGMFQFGSLDDRGVLIIWSVIDFNSGDDAVLTDKCVEIGGRIKLVVSSVIDTQQQFISLTRLPSTKTRVERRDSSTLSSTKPATAQKQSAAVLPLPVGPIACTFDFLPEDSNQYVVGTVTGVLLRGHRFEKSEKSGSSKWPRAYRRDSSPRASAGVTSVSFHPFVAKYFLVGYSDGVVCLYHTDIGRAVSVWDEAALGAEVCQVAWSTSQPSVFFASFTDGVVMIWDLHVRSQGPVVDVGLRKSEKSSPALESLLHTFSLSSSEMRVSPPAIAWSTYDDGSFGFEVHALGNDFHSSFSSTELSKTIAVLSSII